MASNFNHALSPHFNRKKAGIGRRSVVEPLENRTLFATNLLVNGDFEIPQIGAGSSGQGYQIYSAGGTVGSGWLVTTGNVDIQSNAAGAKYATTAAHGNQWLDINGSELGAISQPVTTVVGTKYVIQLAYASNPFQDNISPVVREMSLSENTTLLATISKSAGGSASNLGWQTVSYSFTATAKLTTISCVALTPGDEGVGIDNMSMVAAATTITVKAASAQTATVGVSKSFTLGSFTETNATGPYTATVNWGDGTTNSTIKLTAAGTIPATAHKFAGSGSKTVSVTVTDSAGHTSNKVTFAVTVATAVSNASISGTVFNDTNADGKIDDGEYGLGLWTVYIDTNNNGKLDSGEKSTTTNINGAWSFTGLAAGTYFIRVVPVGSGTTTTPTGGVLKLVLTAGKVSTGNLFGEKAAG